MSQFPAKSHLSNGIQPPPRLVRPPVSHFIKRVVRPRSLSAFRQLKRSRLDRTPATINSHAIIDLAGDDKLVRPEPDEDPLFPLFPKLPPELRSRVWYFTLPAPRRVELNLRILKEHAKESAPPLAFSICKESRQEALRHYTRIPRVYSRKPRKYVAPLIIDKVIDRPFIEFAIFKQDQKMSKRFDEINEANKEVLKSIEYLEILTAKSQKLMDTLVSKTMMSSLLRLPNLKKLFISLRDDYPIHPEDVENMQENLAKFYTDKELAVPVIEWEGMKFCTTHPSEFSKSGSQTIVYWAIPRTWGFGLTQS